MKADETKSVAHEPAPTSDLWNKTRSYIDFRVVGVVVVLFIVAGVWWYAMRQTRDSTSGQWKAYELIAMKPNANYDEFAQQNSGDLAGKVAELEVARGKLNSDGIAKLSLESPEEQQKGLDNIDEARDIFVKLAKEFPDNPTLKVESLLSAADAEIALAGIPKTPAGTDYRGSVKEAANLYRESAKVIGEENDYAKTLLAKADELEKNASEVIEVSQALHARLSPTTQPGAPGTGPKPPIGLETPIESVIPGIGPNEPKGPLTIPTPEEQPKPKEEPKPEVPAPEVTVPETPKVDPSSTEIKPVPQEEPKKEQPKK